jgi:hypothetical protein
MMKSQGDSFPCIVAAEGSKSSRNFGGHVITSSHALSSNFFPLTPITMNRP